MELRHLMQFRPAVLAMLLLLTATAPAQEQALKPPQNETPNTTETPQNSTPPSSTQQNQTNAPLAPQTQAAPPPAHPSPEKMSRSALIHKAWKMLAAGAIDDNKEKRATAIRVLGLLPHDRRALRMAESALSDKDAGVRAAAAEALGQMGAKSSRVKLRATLNDSDPQVVLAAANALRLLHDNAAYKVYYAVLTGRMKSGHGLLKTQEETLKDPKKMALLGFEEGIGQIPFAGIGFSAIRALRKDDSSPVRAAAAKVLAHDPDPDAGKALVESAIEDKSWIVRTAALDAIAHRGKSSLLPKIVPALTDDRDEVRLSAAAAVVRLSQRRLRK